MISSFLYINRFSINTLTTKEVAINKRIPFNAEFESLIEHLKEYKILKKCHFCLTKY